MAITRIGVGAQAASDTANVSAVYPGAYTIVNDDLAVVLVVGKSAVSGIAPATPAGYTLHGSRERFTGSRYLRLLLYIRLLQTGDAAPTFVIPADWSSASGGGISAQMAVYRGQDTTTIFDGVDTGGDSASVSTWQPPGITTVTANTWVLSIVASNDDNALGLLTANSFTAAMSGASYDTTLGGDHSVGLADRSITTAGLVTMPVWEQTVNGPKAWVGLTMMLRPSGVATRRAVVTWVEFEVPTPPVVPSTVTLSQYAPRPAGALEHLELWTDVEANGGILIAPIARWFGLTEKVGLNGEHTLTLVLPFAHPVARLYDTPVDDENLRANQVIRKLMADGTWSEHRISETTRQHQGGTRTRTLIARSIFQDLAFRGMVTRTTADGKRTTTFQCLSLPMADQFQFFTRLALIEAGAPFWDLGTVAHSLPIDMVYDGDTPMSNVRKLVDVGSAEVASGALELGYTASSTGYELNIVEQIGAELDPLTVRARRDLIDLGFTERTDDQATRIYPRGLTGEDGQRPGPGTATWNVVAQVAGPDYWDLTLRDPSLPAGVVFGASSLGEGAIQYDGQFLPPAITVDDPGTAEVEIPSPCFIEYVTGFTFRAPIIATTAATQTVRVQTVDPPPDLFEDQLLEGGGTIRLGFQRVRIVTDALGTELQALDHPAMVAKYGVRVANLDRDDIPGTENLVPNPIGRDWPSTSVAPRGWQTGTDSVVTRETSPRYWEHGGQAVRVRMNGGILGNNAVFLPRALLPFGAQGFLSFFVRVTTTLGQVRVSLAVHRRLTDADGVPTASLPFQGGGTRWGYTTPDDSGTLGTVPEDDPRLPAVTNIELNTAEDIGIAAAWDLGKYPLYGGYAQIIVQPGYNMGTDCECVIQGGQLTVSDAQLPLLEGNGGVRLHKAANTRLGLYASPAPTVSVNLVDLAMAEGMRFPYDPMLRLGRPIIIEDPDLDVSVSTRLIGWTRDWHQRLTPSVEISNERPDIVALLASRTRAARHLTTLTPPGTRGLTYAP